MKPWIGKAIATSILFWSLIGCVTTDMKGTFVEKKNIPGSLEGIIKAFDRVTIGVRGRSTNGRELVSRYYDLKGDSLESGTASKERGYSRLRILGDRRPYTLQMQVVEEKRSGDGDYAVTGYNDEKAMRTLKKLIETLAKRPDNKDFIDDFRSF